MITIMIIVPSSVLVRFPGVYDDRKRSAYIILRAPGRLSCFFLHSFHRDNRRINVRIPKRTHTRAHMHIRWTRNITNHNTPTYTKVYDYTERKRSRPEIWCTYVLRYTYRVSICGVAVTRLAVL